MYAIATLIGTTAGAQPPGAGGPPPPPPVSTVIVESRTVPVTYDYVGVTQASKTVEIRARIRGFIESRDFEEGSLVKENTQLFTIDPKPYVADRDIAAARVAQAESRLKLADQEVKRLKSVTVPGAIAESDVDRQVAEQATAAASLQLAEAELAKAKLQLGYTTVTAPMDGLVSKAQKEIGSLVDESQNSLLTTVQKVSPIYVSFQVSEREYLKWREDEQSGALVLTDGNEPYIEVSLLDGSTYEKRGAITFMSTGLDITTGTIEVRGEFENPDVKLRPGQFVKAHIKGWARPNTITVPQRAVNQSPRGPFVYVVDAENKAELRIVELGPWSGTDWIISTGLTAGEKLIVEGLTKVQPGAKVVPSDLAAQPAAPAEPAVPAAPAAK